MSERDQFRAALATGFVFVVIALMALAVLSGWQS
jgi:hypothetical protein